MVLVFIWGLLMSCLFLIAGNWKRNPPRCKVPQEQVRTVAMLEADVDFSKDVGESIEWIFQVERAGEYLLRFRYALPGGGRPLKVELDGAVLVASYAFADSKTWESWQNADIPVRLEPGNHVVRLSSIGSSGPNVDYLAILNTDDAPNFHSPTPDSSPSGKPLLAKEVWHHVAVSASNGKATFF